MGAATLAMASLLFIAGALPPGVLAMKDRAIQIPINLIRPQEVRELLLFVSVDQGKSWRQESYATPDKKFFPFFAKEDGLYWFQICVITNKGERQPADLNQMEPGLMVLIDTQPPVLKITSADKVGDDVVVSWQLQEAYPDLDSMRLEYRAAGDPVGQWYPVQINPVPAGQVRFRPQIAGALQVRMSVQDLAQNQAQTSTTIGTPTNSATTAAANAPMGAGPVSPAGPAPGSLTGGPPILPPPSSGGPIIPPDAPPVQPALRTEAGSSPLATSPRRVEPPSDPNPVATNSPSAPSGPRQDMRNVQLINSTQISLDYEVPKIGPSGLKSVKLYMTRDDGRSWEELADDKDLQSPINATLPGEGVFGFRLVVESGAGLSKGPPMPGDAPELRIEVDLTPPYLELYAPAPDPNGRDTLILRWNASDKNLAPSPIMLEYSTSKSGPWMPITTQPVANTGNYVWKLSPRLPYRVYVRVTARDTAGNIGEVISPEPQLIDLTKPEGHLIGIKSTSVQLRP